MLTNYRSPRNYYPLVPIIHRGLRAAYNRYAAPAAAAAPAARAASAPRKTGRRRRPRMPKKKGIKKDVKQLKKQVKQLRQMDDNTSGTMVYRSLGAKAIISAVNHQKIETDGLFGKTLIETALAQCKFYDPSNPATLVTGSQVAGTYARNCLIQSATSKCTFRNNYQVDCDVTCYLCEVKDDTDHTPAAAWTSGVADQAYGTVTTNTDLGNYPSDYDLVKDLWKLKVVYKAQMRPGERAVVSHTSKDIEYSPSTVDEHALEYQREYKAYMFMFVVRGPISHDTIVADQVTYTQGGIDIFTEQSLKIKYNAGIDLSYIYVNDTSASGFTNAAVCSNQPVADNQAFSQT